MDELINKKGVNVVFPPNITVSKLQLVGKLLGLELSASQRGQLFFRLPKPNSVSVKAVAKPGAGTIVTFPQPRRKR